jgi:hypothetical protein
MPVKTLTISVDSVINLLKDLTDEEKNEIFEKVFIEEDTKPLSREEQEAITKAEWELMKGETIRWPFGE